MGGLVSFELIRIVVDFPGYTISQRIPRAQHNTYTYPSYADWVSKEERLSLGFMEYPVYLIVQSSGSVRWDCIQFVCLLRITLRAHREEVERQQQWMRALNGIWIQYVNNNKCFPKMGLLIKFIFTTKHTFGGVVKWFIFKTTQFTLFGRWAES